MKKTSKAENIQIDVVGNNPPSQFAAMPQIQGKQHDPKKSESKAGREKISS